jgi:KTSC domain
VERVEVPIGLIASYRYFEQTQELEITFRDGRRWTHAHVPRGTYDQMADADFPVHHWATQIRQAVVDQTQQKRYPIVKAT